MIPKLAKGGIIIPPNKPVRPMEEVFSIFMTQQEMILKIEHQKKIIDRLSRKIQRLKKTKKENQVFYKLEFIKNRAITGATQETINKLAIDFINSYLKKEAENERLDRK